MGRLFDAVSSMLNICKESSYEGQPAIELEMAGKDFETDEYYRWEMDTRDSIFIIRVKSIFEDIIEEIGRVPDSLISAKFHNTIAMMIMSIGVLLREETKINRIVLSGGCFQNRRLLRRTISLLREKQFQVMTHHYIPCNDGGISLGQAIVGGRRDS